MDNQSGMVQDNVNKEAAEPSVNQTKNIITSAHKEALHTYFSENAGGFGMNDSQVQMLIRYSLSQNVHPQLKIII
jgi:hypothetical protein